MAESSLSPGKTAYDLPMDDVQYRRKARLNLSEFQFDDIAILRKDKLMREMTGQSMAESSLSPGKTADDLPMDEVRCRRKAKLNLPECRFKPI